MSLSFALSLAHFLGHDIWHPVTKGGAPGYLFWSGIASFLGIFSFAYTNWRRHNCHAPWCPRIGKHPTADGKYVLCRNHHEDVPNKLTLEHILAEHRNARLPHGRG